MPSIVSVSACGEQANSKATRVTARMIFSPIESARIIAVAC
jgi:hypothetical protein